MTKEPPDNSILRFGLIRDLTLQNARMQEHAITVNPAGN